MQLTALQRELQMEDAFQFISSYQEKEGISPTVREVQEHLGVASSSTAYNVIQKLKKQGRICMKKKCPRTMHIVR